MPSAVWNSGASTDMNNVGNYSAAWDATYDLVWDATSTVNCTATAPISCNSITVAAAYSGAWSISGQTLTVAVGASWDGTGTLNLGNGVTANGASGTVHIGAGVGAVTATSCSLTMNGTTGMTIDDDKSITIKSLILGANAKVTNSGAQRSTYNNAGTPLVLGASSSLVVSRGLFIVSTTSGSDMYTIGAGASLSGTATLDFVNSTAGATFNFPALTTTLSGKISIYVSANLSETYNLTGNFSTAGALEIYYSGTNGDLTFNTQNYSITCGALSLGSSAAGTGTYTINLGSSTVSVSSYGATSYNTRGNINFSTSQWTCSGNWTFGSNHTVDPGTSTVTITNTSTVTPNLKTFYNFIVNAATKTITLAGALTLAAGGDLTLTAGTLNLATLNLTVGGDTEINGTSTLTATGSTCSFAGNYTTAAGSTITINAATNYTFTASTTVTTNGKALPQCTFNNNFALNDSCTITRLIRGVDGFTGTFEAGETFTISNLAAANWSGALGALNAVRSSVPGTQFTMVIPNAATLTFYDSQDCIYQGFDITANDGTSATQGNNVRYLTMNVITVAPVTGTAAGGTLLTFTDTGNGMGGNMVVTVGGNPAGAETVLTTQTSTAITPAGVAGVVNIVITNGDGDTRTLVGAFTYEAVGGITRPEARCWIGVGVGI